MSGTSSVYHPMLDNLTARLAKIVKQIRGEARLTEANIQDALREVRVALLEADVALPVVKHFIEAVRASALGEEVIGSLTPGQALVGLVHRELARLMGGANVGLDLATQPPAVILMAGLQGSGKTTTAGKLAKLLAADKKKVADRKSTRLNSSHGYISYAVFCLKKKKKNCTHNHIAHAATRLYLASTSSHPASPPMSRRRTPRPGRSCLRRATELSAYGLCLVNS